MDLKCTKTTRFADYFVISGLDLNSGLEPDKFAGMYLINYLLIHCVIYLSL